MTYEELIENLKKLASSRASLPKEKYEIEAAKLVTFAEPYGLSGFVKALLFAPVGQQKKAGKIRIHGRDLFPVRNEKEAKAAFNYLKQYRDRLELPLCQKLASKLLAAHYSGVCFFNKDELQRLFKVAGLGLSSKENIIKWLNSRQVLFEKNGKKKHAERIKQGIEDIKEIPQELLYSEGIVDRLARYIDKADKEAKLNNYYYRGVTPPEEFLFSETVKDIQDFSDGLIENVKTGKVYHVSDLSKVDTTLLRQYIDGDFFVDGHLIDHDRFKVWLQETTEEKAELIDNIFEWSGVKPIGQRVM